MTTSDGDAALAGVPGRVVVTGAAGFIGRAVSERYRSLGAEVAGVDLAADEAAGIVAGDTSVPGPWQEVVAGADLVVHTAALVTNTAGLQRAWEVNVLGTRHVLDAAAGLGAGSGAGPAGRVLHLSSVRAFTDLDFPADVDEQHPVRPDGHSYVDTKIASEQVALQAHAAGEVPVTVIRPGDVYGPGSVPWTFWPVIGITSGTFAIPDDGGGVFSPVYVDNLVDGLVAAAATPAAAGQVITISDGIGVTNLEFFSHYYRMLGRDPELVPADELRERFATAGVGADTVDYLLRRHTYAIAKARTLLGYEPTVGLAEGMARCEVWLRESGLLD
jgi:nucleoside-diphosphate-sugar epimerase